ncbi:TIM barrel protein [Tropicimonas sp. IMCC34043]|uniref:TIM barrel protein n=1 Tax=Tropicimonas sp. IMCC34043 TaxID=2248760 RepID=UPI000E27B8CB|nr:TIM barrel protein [Tropicimonas sp. IMCC34043]
MTRFSACIDLLFAHPGETHADRIRRAAEAGFDAVEFWLWSDKPVEEMARQARDSGVSIAGFVAEPMIWLTDRRNHQAWCDGLARSVETANRFGAPVLIVQAGNLLPDVSHEDQASALTDALSAGADVVAGSGVVLGLEPLNTRVDHVGYFLDATTEALDIVDAVARPEVGILFDLYHSAVMDEAVETVLAGRVDRVVHAHVADHPGRNEPGSGRVGLERGLRWMLENGYKGRIGLEYKPATPGDAAVTAVRERLASALADLL